MASCLVPDFPAVMVALEHVKELDKQLKEDRVPFAPEASVHLTEITTAVTELEADRRAAHEHLEVETIENSKLRHQLNNTLERMSEEMMADVAAARASNAEEIEQLRKDLNLDFQLQEEAVERLETLLSQNNALYQQREQVKAEHEAMIANLNEKITLKYSLQMQLDQTQETTEELKSCIVAVEQDRATLQQNTTLERDAFSVKKDSLSREVDRIDESIKLQNRAIRKCRRELDRVNNKRQETKGHLGELTVQIAKLESSIRRVTASPGQGEKQLEGEIKKHEELRQQREMLKEKFCESGEAFRLAVQQLHEEIATVESKIDEGRTSKLRHQNQQAQILKRQQDEENEVRAEHLHISEKLERSQLQLEERIAGIVKHSKEIKEMDKQMRDLLEADTINKRVFENNQEELYGNVDTEKKNVDHLEGEKERLSQLLEEARRKWEDHVAKMRCDISNARSRYEELRREEAALRQRQPKSSDADLLMDHVTQTEVEYRQKESSHKQEIQQCTEEAESIMASNGEKQREAEEKEEMLKQVEPKWSEEQSRHHSLKELTSDLKRRRTELELRSQALKERTSSLLQPKDEMKAELEELRSGCIDLLDEGAAELRDVEVSIYNNSVKLEQVGMENSRLHLRIRQMTEDVHRAQRDKNRYLQESQLFNRDTKALTRSLQGGWREDLLVTQDWQSSDGVLLEYMSSLRNHVKTRGQQIGNVGTLLHHQMFDFSRRLGDKTTVTQQH